MVNSVILFNNTLNVTVHVNSVDQGLLLKDIPKCNAYCIVKNEHRLSIDVTYCHYLLIWML